MTTLAEGTTVTRAPRLSAELLKAAREWLAECEWREGYEPMDFDEMSDAQIERGIARHYCGGIAEFILAHS